MHFKIFDNIPREMAIRVIDGSFHKGKIQPTESRYVSERVIWPSVHTESYIHIKQHLVNVLIILTTKLSAINTLT